VIVLGRAGGKRVQASWAFRVNPAVAVAQEAASPATPAETDDESGIPEMIPAS